MAKKITTVISLIVFTLAGSFVLRNTSPINTKLKNSTSKKTETERWAKKQTFKPTKSTEVQQPEELSSELINIDLARKYLGFELKLPSSPKATAAGEPEIKAPKGTAAYVRTNGTPPKPDNPVNSGATVNIKYPNGLTILVKIRHPQDPTKNYQLHVEDTNKMKKYWSEKGYMDGQLLQLTKVNGFTGFQEEAGFNFVGFLGEDTPTPELKEPAPAMVVWYDDKNWAEYDVRAPLGVSLKELREVVDSIYQ